MASELEFYKAEVERMKAEQTQFRQVLDNERVTENLGYGPSLEGMSDGDLRAYIAERSGARPHGNSTRQTLLSMAQELTTDKE